MQTIIIIILIIIIEWKSVEEIITENNINFTQIFAPPGAGKTTLAAKIVKECLQEDKEVYSNVNIIGAKEFELKDLGKKKFENCTIIIDEAGIDLNNRNWKSNLNQKQVEFLKLHRHYKVNIYLFSQTYDDMDKKMRDLTTKLILLEKSHIPFLIKMRRIKKNITIDINGELKESYEWEKFGTSRFSMVPCWCMFNSYEKPNEYEKNKAKRYFRNEKYGKLM